MNKDWGRKTKSYAKARREALVRDNYKCRFPNCKRKATQVHHIIRYSDSIYLMWSVGNLISLCYKCHKKIQGKEIHYIRMFCDILNG